MSRLVYDGQPIEFADGDTVALAAIRNGQHPARGGTLCLAGDCGNCIATVDGTSWIRTCQTPARPGTIVGRHPDGANPTMLGPDTTTAIEVRRHALDVVVVGGGSSGTAAAAEQRAAGHDVTVFDAGEGNEVECTFAGPSLIVRTATGIDHVHAHHLVLATGQAELHPVAPCNMLAGIFTARAAAAVVAAGIDLGTTVTVGADVLRFEGDGKVSAVVLQDGTRHACDTVIVDAGSAPRDLLARMAPNVPITIVGTAAAAHELPPAPTAGVVCPCSKVTVEDLEGVWAKGFQELELVKRASLCGTGTCQGSACGPHLQAWVGSRKGERPLPFTGRPAARQLTMGEAAAGYHIDTFRRTPLHEEHVALGAQLDKFGGWFRPWTYGDPVAEYWAVREGVSIGDV
ncbi:MAG: hypothetical protein JWN39_743, partial [Ilumatobacteraceae bacterium]|nr:hypothetical protein [Ilumatobacteraceae bacterium]